MKKKYLTFLGCILFFSPVGVLLGVGEKFDSAQETSAGYEIAELERDQFVIAQKMKQRLKSIEEQSPNYAKQNKVALTQLKETQVHLEVSADNLKKGDLMESFRSQTDFLGKTSEIFGESIHYIKAKEGKTPPIGTFLDKPGQEVHYPKEKKMMAGKKPFYEAENFEEADIVTLAVDKTKPKTAREDSLMDPVDPELDASFAKNKPTEKPPETTSGAGGAIMLSGKEQKIQAASGDGGPASSSTLLSSVMKSEKTTVPSQPKEKTPSLSLQHLKALDSAKASGYDSKGDGAALGLSAKNASSSAASGAGSGGGAGEGTSGGDRSGAGNASGNASSGDGSGAGPSAKNASSSSASGAGSGGGAGEGTSGGDLSGAGNASGNASSGDGSGAGPSAKNASSSSASGAGSGSGGGAGTSGADLSGAGNASGNASAVANAETMDSGLGISRGISSGEQEGQPLLKEVINKANQEMDREVKNDLKLEEEKKRDVLEKEKKLSPIREWLLQERLLIAAIKKFKPVRQPNNPNPPWEHYVLRQQQLSEEMKQIRRRIQLTGRKDEYFMELRKLSEFANRLLDLMNWGEYTEYEAGGKPYETLLKELSASEVGEILSGGELKESEREVSDDVPEGYSEAVSRYFTSLSE
jgi:hypothetical protein